MNVGDRVQHIHDPERRGTVEQAELGWPPGKGWVTVDWGDGMPTYHREDELEEVGKDPIAVLRGKITDMAGELLGAGSCEYDALIALFDEGFSQDPACGHCEFPEGHAGYVDTVEEVA